MKKINPNKIYEVEWNDIQAHTNEHIERPYDQFLCKSKTMGRIEIKVKVILVIYGDNKDGEKCFDAIPQSVIINIKEL